MIDLYSGSFSGSSGARQQRKAKVCRFSNQDAQRVLMRIVYSKFVRFASELLLVSQTEARLDNCRAEVCCSSRS